MAANYNYFVSIKISLTNFVFKLIQRSFYSQTMLVRLNEMYTEKKIIIKLTTLQETGPWEIFWSLFLFVVLIGRCA